MSVLPIYNCFHPILSKKTKKIENIDDKIIRVANDMLDTMYNADGIGLAGNQVGLEIAITTIDVNAGDDDKSKRSPIVMLNPVITSYSDREDDYKEGCLSIPNVQEYVTRPEAIEMTYIGLDGNEYKIEADDLLARVIQHELDHLNGILFTDRLGTIQKALLKSKLKKVKNADFTIHYPMINPDGSEMN